MRGFAKYTQLGVPSWHVCVKSPARRRWSAITFSHANNKTNAASMAKLAISPVWVESERRWVRLRITNAALRTIDKVGIDVVLADLRARGEI